MVPASGFFSPAAHPGEAELKYMVSQTRSESLCRWLDMVLTPHPQFAVSRICSIYFDSPRLSLLMEKADSTFHKTKVRLRWYEDLAGGVLPSPAFIELKCKSGSRRFKHRAELPVGADQIKKLRFDTGELERLVRDHAPAGAELPVAPLLPMMELRYVRRRYTHPVFPTTFCFDSKICTVRTHPAHLPFAHGVGLPFDIFEQKGLEADPLPVLRALPRFGAQRAAVSKYFSLFLQLNPHHEHS